VWFPLHPAGFILSLQDAVGWYWSSFLIGWVIKWLIYRYGGTKAIWGTRRFFVGIIIGVFLITGIFSLLGMLIPPTHSGLEELWLWK
jgi:hypothetical protein